MKHTARRIKRAREAAGFKSATAAAAKLGINQNTYLHIENGRRQASIENFRKIADLFEVSLDWLIRGIGDSNNAAIPREARVKTYFEIMLPLTPEEADSLIAQIETNRSDN